MPGTWMFPIPRVSIASYRFLVDIIMHKIGVDSMQIGRRWIFNSPCANSWLGCQLRSSWIPALAEIKDG